VRNIRPHLGWSLLASDSEDTSGLQPKLGSSQIVVTLVQIGAKTVPIWRRNIGWSQTAPRRS
jgi:hypothetical protein